MSLKSELLQDLQRLIPADFNWLVLKLNVPLHYLPPVTAPPADRAFALVEWADGLTGCGLPRVKEVLQAFIEENRREFESDRDCWEQLWNSVTCWDGIEIKTSKIPTLGLDPITWGEKAEEVPKFSWEDELYYEVRSKRVGYLILIQKVVSENAEEFYFLAPSSLVKQPIQPAQNHKFPSKEGKFIDLTPEKTGEDRIIAIINERKPDFSWLKSDNQDPKKLQERDLQEVLRFIQREENCEVIGARFRIVKPR